MRSVMLDGVSAEIISGEDDKIVVIASNSSVSSVPGTVEIVADNGILTLASEQWRYLEAGRIVSVSPSKGRAHSEVIVSGLRLRGGSSSIQSAMLAGVSARIVFESDLYVVVEAGPGPASGGRGAVVLTGSSGAEVRLEMGFTYAKDATVSAVMPSSGVEGAVVTLLGTGLLGGASDLAFVSLGGSAADRKSVV